MLRNEEKQTLLSSRSLKLFQWRGFEHLKCFANMNGEPLLAEVHKKWKMRKNSTACEIIMHESFFDLELEFSSILNFTTYGLLTYCAGFQLIISVSNKKNYFSKTISLNENTKIHDTYIKHVQYYNYSHHIIWAKFFPILYNYHFLNFHILRIRYKVECKAHFA